MKRLYRKFSQKGLFHLTPACIVDADFLLPNKIIFTDAAFRIFWNLTKLQLFLQLFFLVSNGLPKEKKKFFWHFPLILVFKKYDTTDKKIPRHYAMEGFSLLYIHVGGQDRNLSEPT